MAERETSRYIDETASDWIARLDRGPLSEEESQAFEAWLSGDARRRGALLRANAISMMSESARALGPDFEPRQFANAPAGRPPLLSRRRVMAMAGVGGIAAASIVALGINTPAAGAITTGVGEMRLVKLDDGSTVMLNTQTSVKIRYSNAVRRVELLYGEAYFTVADDRRRPFLVETSGTSVRATQAAFLVRRIEGKPVDILVDRGGATAGIAGTPAPIPMQAHSRLLIPLSPATATSPAPAGAAPAPRTVSSDLVSRALAWRDGKIAFEGERLDQAAAEFARYSKVRIEIADPDLAREPVTGLFAARDPVGFGRTVASIFDARMDQQGGAVILSRGAPRKKFSS